MSESKNKLHAVLAVEPDVEAAANKIMKETIETFTKRTSHFEAYARTLKFFDDARAHEAAAGMETKELTTTVPARLCYQEGFIKRWLNVAAQKEITNTFAKADLVVDGETVLKDIPATLLLNLEHKLKAIRDTFKTIPTLKPGIKWELDEQKGPHVYRAAEPERTHKTEKTFKVVSLAKATKEHPEQVEKFTIDVPVGEYTKISWSGMMSGAGKAELLKRIDSLLQGVKMARQRANDIEVKAVDIGGPIFDFLNK